MHFCIMPSFILEAIMQLPFTALKNPPLFSICFHIIFYFSSVLAIYDNYTRQTNRGCFCMEVSAASSTR